MSSREHSRALRTVLCVSCECPRWPPDSWLGRSSRTPCWPALCSGTSGAAERASGSCIPRSTRDSSKSSEPSMSNGLDRPAIAVGFGETFETVVVPHLGAGYRLARWLVREAHDAGGVVEGASLRG